MTAFSRVFALGSSNAPKWTGRVVSLTFHKMLEREALESGKTGMIPGRAVLDFIVAEPFRPFRLNMSSSRFFDVHHPEMIEVGRSSLTVFWSLANR